MERVCCSLPRLAGVLAVAALLPYGCNRPPAAPPIQRLAVLRFENLSGDASADWMGRAFSEILTASLAGAPGIVTLPAGRLRAANSALGARPVSVPGISSERTMALAAGANRAGYGDYSTTGGRLQARLTIEDLETGKMTQVVSTSGAADVLAAASGLARRISPQVLPYGTNNLGALKAWVAALESSDGEASRQALEQAIASDPDFAPPYRALAEWKMQHQDRAGAQGLLEQALARGDGIAPL